MSGAIAEAVVAGRKQVSLLFPLASPSVPETLRERVVVDFKLRYLKVSGKQNASPEIDGPILLWLSPKDPQRTRRFSRKTIRHNFPRLWRAL